MRQIPWKAPQKFSQSCKILEVRSLSRPYIKNFHSFPYFTERKLAAPLLAAPEFS